jgi:hypothetical protein
MKVITSLSLPTLICLICVVTAVPINMNTKLSSVGGRKNGYQGEFVANEYQKDVDAFTDEEVFGKKDWK